MAITRGVLSIARRLRRDVGVEADDATRAITTAWVQVWDEQAAGWRQAAADLVAESGRLGHWPRPTDIARLPTVMQALDRAETSLAGLAKRAGDLAVDAAARVIDLDAEREPRLIAAQAPTGEQEALARHLAGRLVAEQDQTTIRTTVVSRIRTDAVSVIRRRAEGQIVSDLLPLSGEATEAMRRELIRGVDIGDNPRQAAARMVASVEGRFNGGLTRALNIARTEILDAYRATSAQIHQANADIVPAWQWLATFDLRTCPSCLSLHGTTYPSAQPGPDDHQQGRCARLPVLTSWAELGITAPEPPDSMPDAEQWFSSLPEADQLRIMGAARLELLRTGRVGWGDLSTVRQSGRWRPSRIPTPVRDLRRRVERGLPPTPRRLPQPRVFLGTRTLPAPQLRVSPTQQVEAGDFSRLTAVGPQRGSNPGGLYRADDGTRWYVKALPEGRAREEALAAALYRAAGVRVPAVHVGRSAPGLHGEWQVASRLVDDAASVTGTAQIRSQLREGFGVDAWLANWDVAGAGWDNVVVAGGNVWRVDAGGALRYRAKGQLKGAAFGDEVTEWLSLRDMTRAPVAARAFGGMTPTELLAAARRVQAVKAGTIRDLVRAHGLDSQLSTVLIRRRKNIVDRLPMLREQAKRHTAYERALTRAVVQQAALDATPRRLLGADLVPAPVGWSPTQVSDRAQAALSYVGSGYRTINGALREAADGTIPRRVAQSVEGLDALIGTSELRQHVLGYRGVRNPHQFVSAWNDVDVTGLTWTDWGFSSMSANPIIAEAFAGSLGEGSVVMRILARPGQAAFQLSDMSYEAEILLRRGATFRVVADHGVVDNRRMLDVEIVT